MKIGIIGSSTISEKFATAVNQLHNTDSSVELFANYSRNIETATKFGQKFGIESSYDDKLEMFKMIDLVYIATPNKLHFDDVKLALTNGIHVLVEKPMTITYEQTNQLFELANKNNLVLVEAIKTVAMNTYQSALDNIGLIGEVKSFRFNMMREYGNFPTAVSHPNIFKKAMEGGVISDLGSYALFPYIDFIPQSTEISNLDLIVKKYGLDVDCEVIADIELENKINGLITLSMKNGEDSKSYIYGQKGYMTIDSLSQFNTIKFFDLDDNPILVINRDDVHLMHAELALTVDLINSGEIENANYNHRKSATVASLIEKLHEKSYD